jgi:hypothetical protein
VFFAVVPVFAVEACEIFYVVGEYGSLLVDSAFKLVSIDFTSALQLQNMDCIIIPLPENLGERGSYILIEQNADFRH